MNWTKALDWLRIIINSWWLWECILQWSFLNYFPFPHSDKIMDTHFGPGDNICHMHKVPNWLIFNNILLLLCFVLSEKCSINLRLNHLQNARFVAAIKKKYHQFIWFDFVNGMFWSMKFKVTTQHLVICAP